MSVITLFIVILIIVAAAIFSLQNAAPVAVAFLSWKFEASLAVIILLSTLIGILVGAATASFWRLKRSIRGKKAVRQGAVNDVRHV